MSSSPTSLTLKLYRSLDYHADVVEHWNPHTKTRKDMFGFVDIVAVNNEGKTLFIQATSTGNMGARVKKIQANETYQLIRNNPHIQVLVIGWKKYAKPVDRKYWRPTIKEL